MSMEPFVVKVGMRKTNRCDAGRGGVSEHGTFCSEGWDEENQQV